MPKKEPTSFVQQILNKAKQVEQSLPYRSFLYGFESSGLGDPVRSIPFWKSSATRPTKDGRPQGVPDIDALPIELRIPYWGGRVVGDVVGNMTRHLYWKYNHPLGIWERIGREIPRLAEWRQAPQWMGPLSGFVIANALDIASGNTDIFNIGEFGRPKGYAAIFPSPEDPTKSQAPLLELPVGYIFGRRGKLLDWERFHKEMPHISPEKYAEYKEYQSFNKPGLLGLESANPIATSVLGAGIGVGLATKNPKFRTTGRVVQGVIKGGVAGLAAPAVANMVSRLGILKGTWSNLEGEPEVQLIGYKVPLSGALVTAGVGAGMYALMREQAKRDAARIRNPYLGGTETPRPKIKKRTLGSGGIF